MAAPIFLYPSLTDEMKDGIFQAKPYSFSYTSTDGTDKELACEISELNTQVSCLKTDGVWTADKYNLYVLDRFQTVIVMILVEVQMVLPLASGSVFSLDLETSGHTHLGIPTPSCLFPETHFFHLLADMTMISS